MELEEEIERKRNKMKKLEIANRMRTRNETQDAKCKHTGLRKNIEGGELGTGAPKPVFSAGDGETPCIPLTG